MKDVNYLEEANTLASLLVAHGFVTEAEALNDAISADSTGTEIVMRLRFELRSISSRTDLPDLIVARASTLANYLTKILGDI